MCIEGCLRRIRPLFINPLHPHPSFISPSPKILMTVKVTLLRPFALQASMQASKGYQKLHRDRFLLFKHWDARNEHCCFR
jgi:hypothetical protein